MPPPAREKEDCDFTRALEMAQNAHRLFPGVEKICKSLEKCEGLYLMFEAGPSEVNGGHQPGISLSIRQGQHEEEQPDTFWTCCPLCKEKYEFYKVYANRRLHCPICQTTFLAHEDSPGSFKYQFMNHKDSPIADSSKVVSRSTGGTGNLLLTRFENGNAVITLVPKAGIATDGSGGSSTDKYFGYGVGVRKEGIEISKSGPESGECCKSRNRARVDSQHVITEEKDGNPVELNGGHYLGRSSRKRQSFCYSENLNDEDDFVSPPKRSRDSHMSGVTEKEHKNATVDGGVFKKDRSTHSAAAAVDQNKKEPKRKLSVSLEERFLSKKSKTGEFELKAKEAAMPEKEESKSEYEVGSGPNSNAASMPNSVEFIDTEFSKFVLDKDMLETIFSANQLWALYDSIDGMPRFYALIKKVCAPGFKLKIIWLEPNPDDQGESAWCSKELPVACGMYRFGHTEEVTDHHVFSHQMHFIKGTGRSSFLVYPVKGETWALYRNWDIGWSSEPERHMPYKFEYVEVMSDFRQDVGIEVAYLGKVKGFVSLFKRTKKRGVDLFRVPPNELYRFSHQIPSFKMTGEERDGVPKGSFELDTAALPTNLDDFSDVDDLEMDNQSMKA